MPRNPDLKRATDRRYRQSAKGKATQTRYRATAKGKARDHRYNTSEKKKKTNARYRATHLILRMGGLREQRHVYPVPEGTTKDELQERLATFRQKQREEYRDARIG